MSVENGAYPPGGRGSTRTVCQSWEHDCVKCSSGTGGPALAFIDSRDRKSGSSYGTDEDLIQDFACSSHKGDCPTLCALRVYR